jgi:hypothetical protein
MNNGTEGGQEDPFDIGWSTEVVVCCCVCFQILIAKKEAFGRLKIGPLGHEK